MSYADLLSEAKRRIRDARNMQTIIRSPEFEIIYKRATDKEIFHKCRTVAELRYAIRKVTDLDEMPLRWLRYLASLYGVKYYCSLSRADLISELREVQDAK